MSLGMDAKFVVKTMKNVMEDIMGAMVGMSPSEPMQDKEIDIVEYNGRMRCMGIEKFNAPAYISVINFYLNDIDAKQHKRVKGALVLYIEFENAGKLYKNLGISIPEDEDDASMMKACGEFAKIVTEAIKKEFAKDGYADLFTSDPFNYKNSIMEGVEYSSELKTKQEVCLFYWKRKAIVLELTLSMIPLKK